MSTRGRSVRGLCVAACLAACSSQTPPATTPEPEPAPEPQTPAEQPELGEAAEPSEGEQQPAAPSEEEGSEETPPKEPLASLCNKMCDAVAPKCTPLQLKGCRSTCDGYEAHPPACDGVVRTALECARADKDFLFCANVVPDSCAKEFKAINICNETGAPPKDAQAQGMPDGWERYKGPGFSVIVPKGMKAETRDGIKTWRVKAPSGVVYEVALHRPPTGKLDNRAFLRAGNAIFGKCSPKLKLHALVEKPGHTSIQYNTTCPDGQQQLGRMHVIGDNMYILTAYLGSGGSTAETDAFVYSFESG